MMRTNDMAVFGAAQMGQQFIRAYSNMFHFSYVLDNNVDKQGTDFEGISVISPQELADKGFSGLIILASGYHKEMASQLMALGFERYISAEAFRHADALQSIVPETVFRRTSQDTLNFKPVLSEEKCTGCAACAAVCPQQCISMTDNPEGFRVPMIGNGCTKCGCCTTLCPSNNHCVMHSVSSSYAVQANDTIRAQASSGGFFPVAARAVLEQGGYVAGAAWSDDFMRVEHRLISDVRQLPELCYSKYVQSDVSGDFYKSIRKTLSDGYTVLFSGVPCQIAGLMCFLGKEYRNLITIEMICHGVPSPLAWKKFLAWKLADYNSPLIEVCHRDKEIGWHGKLLLLLSDGTKIREKRDDAYFRSFLSDINLRKCCYTCNLKNNGLMRPSDITIGDAWGIEKYDARLDDGKGTSVVLLNTEKADEFFHKLSFAVTRKIPIDNAVQRALLKPFSEPKPKRSIFFRALMHEGVDFNCALQQAEQQKADVMLLGRYNNENIGGQLTVLAAYKVIEQLGYIVKLARHLPHFPASPKRRLIWEHLCGFSIADTSMYPKQLNDEADSFVTCSDWTFYKTFGAGWDIFTQPFVSEDKKRIALAASLGDGGGYNESDFPELKRRLQRFNTLSIREPSGIALCKSIGVENAIIMHDPVFGLDKEYYEALSELDSHDRLSFDCNDYAAVYLRDYSAEKVKAVLSAAEQHQLVPLFLMGYAEDRAYVDKYCLDNAGIQYITDITMCEWLHYIRRSGMVITDSFHASCFALIFNRDFITFNRYETPRFSKLSNLLGRINLMDRLIQVGASAELPVINWEQVNECLCEWKQEIRLFTEQALKG